MRVASRVLRIAVVTLAILVGVFIAAVLVTRTDRFHDWLRRYVAREITTVVNGDVSIGRLSGTLFSSADLEDVRVTQAGKPVVLVRSVGLRYNVLDFVTKGIIIDAIRITSPRIALIRTRDGWNISALVKAQQQEADRQGPARPIRISTIGISDGRVTIDDRTATPSDAYKLPASIDRIDGAGDFAYQPVRMTVRLGHLSFRASDPALALNSMSGQVSVRDDDVYIEKVAVRTAETSLLIDGAIRDYLKTPRFNVTASSDKLTPREFGGLIPAVANLTVQPAAELKVSGPLSDLQLETSVRSSAGQLRAQVRGDVASPLRTLHGHLEVAHVDPDQILNRRDLPTDITGAANFDVHGRTSADVAGRAEVDASAKAYGGAVTLRGRIASAGGDVSSVSYDLKGHVTNVNADRLPLPPPAPRLTSAVSASYHVRGTGMNPVADLQFARSTVEGATLADGTTAHVELRGAHIAYAARGSFAGLDPQRLGNALHVDALSSDRAAGEVAADFDLRGSGRTLAELSAHADITVHDSALGGGRIPQLAISADVEHQSLNARVRGRLDGFDPGRISGRTDSQDPSAARWTGHSPLRTCRDRLTSAAYVPRARSTLRHRVLPASTFKARPSRATSLVRRPISTRRTSRARRGPSTRQATSRWGTRARQRLSTKPRSRTWRSSDIWRMPMWPAPAASPEECRATGSRSTPTGRFRRRI